MPRPDATTAAEYAPASPGSVVMAALALVAVAVLAVGLTLTGPLPTGGSLPGVAAADCPVGALVDSGVTVERATRLVVVEDAATGAVLLAAPAENGTPVALEYTHSVERTRVLDGYAVRGDRLEMVRMEFESYGAGLPARAAVNRTPEGSFVFDPDGAYRELYVDPGRVAGHVLRVGSHSRDLVALSNASAVRLHLRPAVACAEAAEGGR